MLRVLYGNFLRYSVLTARRTYRGSCARAMFAVCFAAVIASANAERLAGSVPEAAAGSCAGQSRGPVGGANVPLESSGAGSLLICVRLGSKLEPFLLDTGASMVTIGADMHQRLRREGLSHPVREVAARLADGRMQMLAVHRIDVLELSAECSLQDVEVLVMPGTGRNLLGLNALSRFAPLTLHMQPPALELSRCAGPMTIAASAGVAVAETP